MALAADRDLIALQYVNGDRFSMRPSMGRFSLRRCRFRLPSWSAVPIWRKSGANPLVVPAPMYQYGLYTVEELRQAMSSTTSCKVNSYSCGSGSPRG
jgi:hypothetical protein